MFKFRHIISLFALMLSSFLRAETDSLPNLADLDLAPYTPDTIEITGANVICSDSLIRLAAEVKVPLLLQANRWIWKLPNKSAPLESYVNFLELNPFYDFPGMSVILIEVEVYHNTTLLGHSKRPIFITSPPAISGRINDTLCKDDDGEAILGIITTDMPNRYFQWYDEQANSLTGHTDTLINVSWWGEGYGGVPPNDSTFYVRVSNFPLSGRFYSTTFNLYITYENTCYTRDSAQVIVRDKLDVHITGDTQACLNSTVWLTLHDGANIVWDNANVEPTTEQFIANIGKNYFYAEVTDTNGCRGRDSFYVQGLPAPVKVEIAIHSADGDDTICRGTPVQLIASAEGAESYYWPALREFGPSVDILTDESASYEVWAYAGADTTLCKTTQKVDVNVRNCNLIYFASAISLSSQEPKNRIFKPIGEPQGGTEYYLAIFNRWGQLIFESTNFYIGWNGTHQGENVRPGAYVYLFRSKYKKNTWEKIGTITVID